MVRETPNPTTPDVDIDPTFAIDPEEYEAWLRAEEAAARYFQSIADADAEDLGDPADPATVSYRHCGVYTIDEMRAERERLGKQPYLVDGYVPIQSITLTVGNSGDGKSPLKYQQGLSIAAGVPFLGLRVTSGRVLYIDFENSVEQSIGLAEDISRVLHLPRVPDNFRVWNAALSTEPWVGLVARKVQEFRPTYVVIDTLSKAFPDAESDNSKANTMLTMLKQLTSKYGCAVDLIHHPKKNSSTPPNAGNVGFTAEDIEQTIQELIKESRGAAALFQGADVRFLTRVPRSTTSKMDDGTCELQLLGFRRVFGTFPAIFLDRVRDDSTGRELGYGRLTGTKRFTNPEHAKVFAALPERFRFKDLAAHWASKSSRTLFLKSCIGLGVVRALDGGEGYQKVPPPAPPAPPMARNDGPRG